MEFLFSFSVIIKILLLVLVLVVVIIYNWKRRWLYYHSSKFPGPLSLPLIGTVEVALAGQKKIFRVFEKLIKTYSNIWRVWIGNQLCIVSSRPQDVEILLNTCLRKENFSLYDYAEEDISSIFTSRVDVWKVHRKIINPSFNQQIINSFTDVFVKYANVLNTELEKKSGTKSFDVLPLVWRCTLDNLFETLACVEPGLLRKQNDNVIRMIVRYEQILTERFSNILLHLKIFWRLSSYYKEAQSLLKEMFEHIGQLIDFHNQSKYLPIRNHDDFLQDKTFLSLMISKNFTSKEIKEETLFMFIAGSETTALTISSVLLIMSIYPDIQEKVYEEQCSIFSDNRDLDLDDVNRMNYLERVIKETMRLLPPAPYVARYIHKDVKLEDYIVPAGSGVIIPIWNVHKNPEHWPNPLIFDPDRFLPEEVEKRPRTSYLAFSYGPRNCIGLKYAMVSIKTVLSTILRNFRVVSGKYKSVSEIELEFHFVGKAKGGYEVQLEKRN